MTNSESPRAYMPEHDLMTFAGVPAVYHCHHFNLFLDQTVDDALGPELGARVRFEAARESAHELLLSLANRAGVDLPVGRIGLASSTFSALGHGRLDLDVSASGGTAGGSTLHYGLAWREKYGAKIGRRDPVDAFAAGYAAAATEVAYGTPRESIDGVETACIATKAPRCAFSLSPGAAAQRRPSFTEAVYRETVRPSFPGQHEETVVEITNGLRAFTAGVAPDERGLVDAFGVLVTMHLAGYYNRISYDAVAHVRERSDKLVPMVETLLRESGHVCVFNTFGGILMSPEWEGMVGAPQTPESVVVGCAAIGRALGFGHWTIQEYVPDHRLVIRTPSTYEASYYLRRHGLAEQPNEYFLQGATLAIAQLAHRVDWKNPPTLDQKFYQALFHDGELPWAFEQTSSLATGDAYSEVVVTRRA